MSAPADPARTGLSAQLLGLAFAAADLLLELRSDGTVGLATGAAAATIGHSEAELVGMRLAEILAEPEASDLAASLGDLAPGRRVGPVQVWLKPSGRPASLRLCRFPQAGGAISCALTLGPTEPAAAALIDPGDFPGAAADLLTQARAKGLKLNLDLVELNGLRAAVGAMDEHAADQTRREVAGLLAYGSFLGAGAAEMAADRFAVLRADGAPVAELVDRLKHLDRLGIAPSAARLALDGVTPEQNLRTLRYALDRYIEDGAAAAKVGFNGAMQRALGDSARFTRIVAERAFHLAYQPVVRLGDESLHHFEALARFDVDGSPADTIRLAEELGMIQGFDLAVAEMVAAVLAKCPDDVRIAVNLSARSLLQEGFIDQFTAITGSDPKLRARMLVEITETAAMQDLELADRAIQALRTLGHPVCLDDFGAGAASLDYVRALRVDFVKIDGRYLQDLDGDDRNRLVLKHLIALCRDLQTPTIVEMVETRQAARTAADLGAELAQGWLFGKPLPEPTWTQAPRPANAKRVGAVEQWG